MGTLLVAFATFIIISSIAHNFNQFILLFVTFLHELKAIILECKNNQDIHQFLCEVFRFVKQYQNFYKACFSGHISISALNLLSMKPFIDTIDEYSKRLNFYSTHKINYHISFFTAGIGEVIKIWLYNGCMESPEEMANVIYEEYRVKF